MGERARVRRAQAEAEERRQWEAEERERQQSERDEAVKKFLAGPPDGCTTCYMFGQRYAGAGRFPWEWWHITNVNPEMRFLPARWEGDEPGEIEHCTCRCHGPDGYPLFVIALA